MTTSTVHTDLAIVGPGPTGLYGAFCAGFGGLRTVVVDSLPEVGGQIAALYPEKLVRDTFRPGYLLGRQTSELPYTDGRPHLTLSDVTVDAGAAILTPGIGTFTPRPVPAGEAFLDRGLSYFVPDLAVHADRDVVVVGGGDSAIDWALACSRSEPVIPTNGTVQGTWCTWM